MSSQEIRIDVQEILTLLPHRYPFMLVDRVVEMELGKRILGFKNVSYNEQFFQGHFPSEPVMPGVLVLEALAQVGGILAYYTDKDMIGTKNVYFTGIDGVKFRKKVVPGDQLILEIVALKKKLSLWVLGGKAFVDGELVAEATLKAIFR